MIHLNELEIDLISKIPEEDLRIALFSAPPVKFKSRVPDLPEPLESLMVGLQHVREHTGEIYTINEVIEAYLSGTYSTYDSDSKKRVYNLA